MGVQSVTILGGGPAGSSAALAALAHGARVQVIEKSLFPRHKVCGEFLSPEIALELERLGVWDAFLHAAPARIRRMKLHFGKREKTTPLPEPAWGLSRYAFDALLLDRAASLGAAVLREPPAASPQVIAVGRRTGRPRRGRRLFGFKAHFEGPTDDAVELYFFDGIYVGVSPVEAGTGPARSCGHSQTGKNNAAPGSVVPASSSSAGRTNVCGLAPEDFLSRFGFDFDAVLNQCPALARRLLPLTRAMKWLSAGPLEYRQGFESAPGVYPAGDALSFVDPFTGSGLLAAVKTGALAGRAAALGEPVPAYLAHCRESLRKPFAAARVFRRMVELGWADTLVPFAPGRLLFALTRPR
jgi:flavin-dependent dehydrogenase